MKSSWDKIHDTSDLKEKAHKCRTLRLETMLDIRKICDEAEAVVPPSLWTLATYKELLFLDQTTA